MSTGVNLIPEFETSASFMMGLAYKQFRTLSNQALSSKLNISIEMLGALKVLSHHGKLMQQGLADALLRERSATKRLVDNCIKRGLIEAYKNEANKKAKYLVITDKGETVKNEASVIIADINEQFFGPLTVEERQVLLNTCRKLIKDDIYLGGD
ncbi:MarR family winged helix-turn-helix transcriptional regulator [Shewanella gelidimarina]|uniref:MarR family winged helix-turn-helix transcriptional regulator n=1 Tax=Shewanella gelidimarina TaxID=56813 RepID=UPI00200F3C23|nr:MarR family winged helix-turn-helix transcriptional regulator [Shewanella gelidimarina]MCL1058360.1 MarR family winged helix-turn-helix transcriptional regulator [Shewanella gelidimarina]